MITVVHDLLELTAPDAEVELVAASDLPEPQRRLLDHARDMTGTLEAFLGQTLDLRALHARREGDRLYRRVILMAGDRPVEYGAIRIDLGALPADVHDDVLAGTKPLGGILTRAGMQLASEARGFLRTRDASAIEVLGGPGPLFGRLARLRDGAGRTLADVVEILPNLPKQLEDRA
ncbi:MAG: hypothetical protein O2816_01010 [Planctomycetota bacterium]|nr:hypothetical protein [Planctomycetota bacterium]